MGDEAAGIGWQIGLPVGVSCAMAFSVSFRRYPNVAEVFAVAGLVWLVALLIVKAKNPALSWMVLWMTVPVMSWYTVNVSLCLSQPISGGGLGRMLGLRFGWLYLMIPFAVLHGVYQVGWMIHRRLRGGKGQY